MQKKKKKTIIYLISGIVSAFVWPKSKTTEYKKTKLIQGKIQHSVKN